MKENAIVNASLGHGTHEMMSTFRTSVALVLEETRCIKGLHRSSRAKLLQFAIDTCLVAHGIRTGYLVDVVFPPNPMQSFATLLKALRGKSSVFKNVMLWHHILTMQSFLVHVPLLQERLTALLNGTGDCVFVKLDKCLSVSREPPDECRVALHNMRFLMAGSPDALSLSLSDEFTEEILIPLAAVMIDYPVAYSPASSAQTSFLEGEVLDIYTISFQGTTTPDSVSEHGTEHILLKFSCPQVLVYGFAELSPGTVIKKLRDKFAARLGHIGARIFVTHRTETLERVAL